MDIKPLKDAKEAAHYVSKYVAKGTSAEVWNSDDLAMEFVTAMKGVRICSTFGSWRGFALMAHKPTAEDWTCVGTLNAIVAAWKKGEAWAAAIALSIRPPGSVPEVTMRLLHDY